MFLIYDTETSGFVNSRLPESHPSQPHLVQLAALLFDEKGVERASVSLIVKPPEGFTIPPEAIKAHGITTEMANRFGVPLAVAVASFTNLRAISDEIVAHNISFDDLVMRAAIHRTGRTPAHPGPLKNTCTMAMASDILKLPPTERMKAAGMNKHKAPNLGEAYQHFFGEPLVGAHDALVDTRACARIFFHMRAMSAEFAT